MFHPEIPVAPHTAVTLTADTGLIALVLKKMSYCGVSGDMHWHGSPTDTLESVVTTPRTMINFTVRLRNLNVFFPN